MGRLDGGAFQTTDIPCTSGDGPWPRRSEAAPRPTFLYHDLSTTAFGLQDNLGYGRLPLRMYIICQNSKSPSALPTYLPTYLVLGM